MRHRLLALTVALAAMMSRGLALSSSANAEKDVTVTVRFVTHDGCALDDWPFALIHRAEVWDNDVILEYGRTDEDGEVVLEAQVAEDVQRLFVELSIWNNDRGRTDRSIRERDLQRLRALEQRYHFPFRHLGFGRVELDGQIIEEEVVVTAEPGLVIRGRLVDRQGIAWSEGSIDGPGPTLAFPDNSGTFVLRGVPKRPQVEIFVNTHPAVVSIPVEVLPDTSTVDLGDVPIVPPETSCRVELLSTGWGPLNEKRRLEIGTLSLTIGGITLISEDGTDIFSYPNHEHGAVNNDLDRDKPMATCGRYFAIPGRFNGNELYMTVLDAIAADVIPEDFGVPMVELEEGRTPIYTFDALKIADAIGQIRKHLDDFERCENQR